MYILVYMNISQHLRPWGNSVGIRLPQAVTKKAGLSVGQQLDISLENGRIVLTPVQPSPDSLDALVSRITPENLHASIDTDEPRGNEEW